LQYPDATPNEKMKANQISTIHMYLSIFRSPVIGGFLF